MQAAVRDIADKTTLLRLSSSMVSVLLFYLVYRCRKLLHPEYNGGAVPNSLFIITRPSGAAPPAGGGSFDAVLVAWCAVLYPINFFYYPLYYTDTVSITSIVGVYYCTLQLMTNPSLRNQGLVFLGACGSICMRQTNAVWVCFCLGIMIQHVLITHRIIDKEQGVLSAAWSVCSRLPAAMGVLLHPGSGVPALLLPVLGFATFILGWNEGSIVVGDKSHHRATLHPAMLLHAALLLAGVMLSLEGGSVRGVLGSLYSGWARVVAVWGAVYLCLLHSARAPHIFTLSDNRHYMFYVWRKVLGLQLPRGREQGSLSWWECVCTQHRLALLAGFYTACVIYVFRRLVTGAGAGDKPRLHWGWVWVYGVAVSLTLLPTPLIEPRYFSPLITLYLLHTPVSQFPVRPLAALYLCVCVGVNALTVWVFLRRPFLNPSTGELSRFMY